MWLGLAAVFGATAVLAAALGTHALRGAVTEAAASSWSTATEVHALHALALLALGLYARATGRSVRLPAALFTAGILLFAGSIYLLVLTPWRWPGPLTPLGGFTLIAAWLSLLALGRGAQAR
jgi:uncharacterized membrane protein YgdD (TMEM256/DUF423 family)